MIRIIVIIKTIASHNKSNNNVLALRLSGFRSLGFMCYGVKGLGLKGLRL